MKYIIENPILFFLSLSSIGGGAYILITFEDIDIDNLVGASVILLGGLSIFWFSFIKKILKDKSPPHSRK
ncbi:MAG: hypothetical protein CVT95_04910 [Bacteroidetes bacterium HGW-Bacteroidetes-12]|nr:MAG: hypothetical protein CVT95_04910 [Bacteroidetes bacterium HGW-Bacteroidetes-12]